MNNSGIFLTEREAIKQNIINKYYIHNHNKSNKFFVLMVNDRGFIKGVKYRVQYETPNCYCVKLKKGKHSSLFLNKNQENYVYKIGIIQNI